MTIRRIKEIERKKQDWKYQMHIQDLQQNNAYYLQELEQVFLLGPEWSADEKDILKTELFFIFSYHNGHKYLEYSDAEKTAFLATIKDSVTKFNINLASSLKALVRTTHLTMLTDLLSTNNIQAFLDNYAKKEDIFLELLDNWYLYEISTIDADKVFSIFKTILGIEPENYRSANGKTVLHLAYSSRYKFMILKLYDKYSNLVNVLDHSGNSPLYYAINDQDNFYDSDNTCNAERYEIYAQLMNYGAKYIRNFIEVKNILHLRVALHQPLELDKLSTLNIDIDAMDLESGRTALTHAVVLKNDESALELIQNSASCIKPDKYNKTPLDYAIAYGDKSLVMTMMQHLPVNFFASKHERSFIATACFSGNTDLYAWLKTNIKHKNELDQAIVSMVERESFILPAAAANLDYKQQLIVYAAVAKMLPRLSHSITNQVRHKVLAKYVANSAKLPSGSAYGVELELSDVPCVPDLPLDLMLKWFDVDFKNDFSVESSIFSAHNLCVFNEEIVSGVLDSTEKIKQFLLFSEQMYNSGATVGGSTGMHVHVNIQGNRNINLPSITNAMHIRNMRNTDVELAVVKQIITNWVEVEPLLQSFLRNGELENIKWFDHHYAAPIKPLLAAYMECQTLDEIIELSPSRFHALNVESLRRSRSYMNFPGSHGHGTIEIRIHEGAIHKLIIASWLNFIDRLVRISVDQVQEKINNNEAFEFTPFDNVKDLVHILLAERNYTLTWDSKLKTARGSTAPVTVSDWSVHERIQNADVYRCYDRLKAEHIGLDCAGEVPIGPKPYAVGNVTNWLRLTNQYPGIFADGSIPMDQTIKDLNDTIFSKSSRNVDSYLPAIILMLMFACLFISNKRIPKPSCPMLFNYNSKRSELPLVNSDTKDTRYGAIDRGPKL